VRIGGLQKVSFIDYPGKISAIIFTQGCNFRCPYCHNPELVDSSLFDEPLDIEEIFSFLKSRKGKIDGVVITGGEPTIQPDLKEFIKEIKQMGFFVKLDTNGTNPDVVRELLRDRMIDYIAMDIKAPLEKYKDVVRVNLNIDDIKESISLIMSSSIDYEFRTTICKKLLDKDDIIRIAKQIKGAKLYVLQKFVKSKTLDPFFDDEIPYSDEELLELKKEIERYVNKCAIR